MSISKKSASEDFAPIFIVGAPRSGTTLLTVLLDRHSSITIPPETQYFTQYLPGLDKKFWQQSEQQIATSVLSFSRIADLNLDADSLLSHIREFGKSPQGLFRAILTSYADLHNAQRIGEKSPRHNEHVKHILEMYPEAKIIALVRDGRDVVNSLLKAPWAAPDSPRRFSIFCQDWLVQLRHIMQNQKRFGPEHHLTVHYEDIIRQPHIELCRICEFINEPFEEQMLDMSIASESVPNWETAWKSKANTPLDKTRLQAWKKERSEREIWRMNMIMGPMLRKAGYTETRLTGCPFVYKLRLLPSIVVRWAGLRPVFVGILRASRSLRSLTRSRHGQ